MQELVSNGHSFHDIMHEYSPGMIRKFYSACIVAKNEKFLDDAAAARFSQATEQSWRTVHREIKGAIKSLIGSSKGKDSKKPVKRGDAELSGFFGMVTTSKSGKRSEKTRGELNANA